MSRSLTSSKADPVHPALTPQRRSRRSSFSSPARVLGRRSSLLKMDSFNSTPGRSILSDNTYIDQPRRQSWWKKLDDHSWDIIESLRNEKVEEANNVLEDLDVEILSQEKERQNLSLDLPESSGSESIGSIIIPQRRIFTQKENVPQKKHYRNLLGPRESLAKLHKTNTEEIRNVEPKKLFGQAPKNRQKIFETIPTSPTKTALTTDPIDPVIPPKKLFNQSEKKTLFPKVVNESPKKSLEVAEVVSSSKNLFQQNTERKTIFPSALLNTSGDKGNKTTEIRKEVQGQVRNLFGNRPSNKRKNMFADFIVSESEDEVPEIQPRVFGFRKDVKRHMSSSSYAVTDGEDDWKMLPSSTMMHEQLEVLSSPVKRPKLSTIPKELASDVIDEIDDAIRVPDDDRVDEDKPTQNKTQSQNNKSASQIINNKSATKDKSIKVTTATDQVVTTVEKALSQEDTVKNKTRIIQNESFAIEIMQNDSEAENVIKQITNMRRQSERLIQNKNKSMNATKITEDMDEVNEIKDKTQVISSKTVNQEGIDNISNKEATLKSDGRKSKTFIINKSEMSNNDDNESQDDVNNKQNNLSAESEPDELIKLTYEDDEVGNDDLINNQQQLDVIAEASNERDAESMEASKNKSNKIVDANQEKESNGLQKISHDISIEKAQVNTIEQDNKNLDNVEVEMAEQNEINIENEEQDPSIDENQENESDQEENESINNEEEPSLHETEDENEGQEESREPTEIEASMEVESEEEDQPEDEDEEIEEPEPSIEAQEQSNQSHNKEQNLESDNSNQEVLETDNQAEVNKNQEIDHLETDEIPGSPNVTHDTTGRNRKLIQTKIKSPEAILHDKTNQNESFELKQRRTSIRKTKSLVQHSPKIQDSIGSAKNSSAEGSGWDSHRTTRKTIRQTFGKDFTPRKSLRALVLEKTAKRQTEGQNRESVGDPQANSTEIIQNFFTTNVEINATEDIIENVSEHATNDVSEHATNDVSEQATNDVSEHATNNISEQATNNLSANYTNDNVSEQYTNNDASAQYTNNDASEQYTNNDASAQMSHNEESGVNVTEAEVSVRTKQATLDMYLEKIRKDILERKQKADQAVKQLLTAPKQDITDYYRASIKPLPRQNLKPKPKKLKPSAVTLGVIPEEILQDMKYKPPKRFMKTDASWITKRLYKYLETKLEPKYDFKARVRAEKFVEHLYNFTKCIKKLPLAPHDSIKELKIIMARLDIVRTHYEFYDFFYEYMPREVRIKVVPDITNKLPVPRHGVFSDIIRGEA